MKKGSTTIGQTEIGIWQVSGLALREKMPIKLEIFVWVWLSRLSPLSHKLETAGTYITYINGVSFNLTESLVIGSVSCGVSEVAYAFRG